MVFKLIKKEKNILVAELEGEDHTLANLLAKYLIRMDKVKFASYHIPHPLVGHPIIRVVTVEGVDPLSVLEEALNTIIKDLRELREKLVMELEKERT